MTKKVSASKVLGILSGFTATKRSVVSNAKVMGQTYPIWKSGYDMLKKPEYVETPIGKLECDMQRFDCALQYYGYETEAELSRQKLNHLVMLCLSLVVAVLLTAYGTYLVLNGQAESVSQTYNMMGTFGLLPLLFAYTFRHLFHYAQIKHRRLFNVFYWIINFKTLTFSKGAEPRERVDYTAHIEAA